MKLCSTICTNRVQLLCITFDPLRGLGGLATCTLKKMKNKNIEEEDENEEGKEQEKLIMKFQILWGSRRRLPHVHKGSRE